MYRAILLASLLSTGLAAQNTRLPEDPGPRVGAAVPAFEAPDQNGKQRTFDNLRGEKGLMLLFVRSADW